MGLVAMDTTHRPLTRATVAGLARLERKVHHLRVWLSMLLIPVTLNLRLNRSTMATAGQTAIATVTELDALGKQIPFTSSNISFGSNDPTVATIASNGDGTATVTAVGPGTTYVWAHDSSNSLGGSAPVTVTAAPSQAPGQATTLVVSLGDFTAPSTSTGSQAAASTGTQTPAAGAGSQAAAGDGTGAAAAAQTAS